MIVFLGNAGKLPDNASWAEALLYGTLLVACILLFGVPVTGTVIWLVLMFNGVFLEWANVIGWTYGLLFIILVASVVYGIVETFIVPYIKKISQK